VSIFFLWAAAVSVALHALLYPVLGLPRIEPGCNPPPGYWRRRLVLNLLETNLGMVLNLGLAVTVALAAEVASPLTWPLPARTGYRGGSEKGSRSLFRERLSA